MRNILRSSKMNENFKSSQVIFLLGAGASKKADVPTTFEFVDQFIGDLGHRVNAQEKDIDRKYKTIKQIRDILASWERCKGKVDIELLLEALNKLKGRKNETILQFCKNREKEPTYQLIDSENGDIDEFDNLITILENDLREFIKSKTIVDKDKINYLKPFRGFIEEANDMHTPLDIISLNYDTCIEQFCNVHKKIYQDGFDLYWNREAFGKTGTDIRLYKLHGSIIWYQSDNGTYMKLPVKSNYGKVELIYGESANNLMLYPMQKWDYAEPLFELLLLVKDLLESDVDSNISKEKTEEVNNFKFLVVVGYSFRDEHIKKIIYDSVKNNRNIYLIIIDPEANRIYHDRLEYQDVSKTIETELKGRVVCLPYVFEGAFPLLKEYYLKNLNEGLMKWKRLQKEEDLAEIEVHWKKCLVPLAKAEFCELVENIVNTKSIKWEDIATENKVEIYLHMAINLLLNNECNLGNKYLADFETQLYKYYRQSFYDGNTSSIISIDTLSYQRLGLGLRAGKDGEFYQLLKESLEYSRARLKMHLRMEGDMGMTNIENNILKMELCINYFDPFTNNKRNLLDGTLNKYVATRVEYLDDFKANLNLNKIKADGIPNNLANIEGNMKQLKEYVSKLKQNPADDELNKKIKNIIQKVESTFALNIMDNLLSTEYTI
jgi:hypothetical protein